MTIQNGVKIRKNVAFLSKIALLFLFSVMLTDCVKSNEKKKEFIAKKQAKTNEKVAKKYGELVIPDFVKEGDYEFDRFKDSESDV